MGWSPESRQRQSAAIQRWKPWSKATGPRTPEGKAKAAMRAWKGNPRGELRAMRKALREQDRFIRDLI